MKTIQQQKPVNSNLHSEKCFCGESRGVGGAHLFHRETSYRFLQQQIDVLSLQAPPFKKQKEKINTDKQRLLITTLLVLNQRRVGCNISILAICTLSCLKIKQD